MTTVLVTGGLGYIGGRTVAHLAARGDLRVVALTHDPVKRRRAGRFEVAVGDVRDLGSLKSPCSSADVVVHLAAVDEHLSEADPGLAAEVNDRGTLNMLSASRAAGVSRFIYFSTYHVYGDLTAAPIDESTPVGSSHPYAATHLAAEGHVRNYRDRGDLSSIVVRLSNGFGYPMDPRVGRWTLVFNDLCLQAVRDRKLTVTGPGNVSRDFVALGDVARAVEHLISLDEMMLGDGTFNLGGERSWSMRQVAEFVAERYRLGFDVEPTLEISDTGPTLPVTFDISKIKGTGFRCTTPPEFEVDRTLDVALERLKLLGE